jgi:hypothetical protein
MKRYKRYRFYLLLVAGLYCHAGVTQETKLSKSINRSFEIKDRLNLVISNKYGNVIIETWPQDEVSLKIEILAFGKDESSAEKLMDRAEFDFKHSDDFLEIASVFDRRKNFFKDLVNAVGDYSASVLSKHKLQVNYELMIPESTASITVTNRFGDVHLADVEARLDLTVAHGNVMLNSMQDYGKLNLNYGKARIKEANEAVITLKGAELELDKIHKVTLKSSSSTIVLGQVSTIDIESTNDKVEIDEVRDISGEINFTDITINHLAEDCRLNQNYGGLTIKQISPDFSDIRLNGKSTDYNLKFTDGSAFEVRIYARDDKLILDELPGKVEKRYMDEKTKFVELRGYVGKEKNDRKLNIDAQNGEVSIGFTKGLPETYNK